MYIHLYRNRPEIDPYSETISRSTFTRHCLIRRESRAPFNNSTSTLLEETMIAGQDARVVRNSSLRRRKNRLRKKNVVRLSVPFYLHSLCLLVTSCN